MVRHTSPMRPILRPTLTPPPPMSLLAPLDDIARRKTCFPQQLIPGW